MMKEVLWYKRNLIRSQKFKLSISKKIWSRSWKLSSIMSSSFRLRYLSFSIVMLNARTPSSDSNSSGKCVFMDSPIRTCKFLNESPILIATIIFLLGSVTSVALRLMHEPTALLAFPCTGVVKSTGFSTACISFSSSLF